MILSQKETTYLQDFKKQEQFCVDMYNKNAKQAASPDLKNMFKSIAHEEQHHGDMVYKYMEKNDMYN